MSVVSEFESEDEFFSIEAAVMETTRGRKFLAEHARRCRTAETQLLLAALQRIEKAVVARPAVETDELGLLSAAIASTCADVAAIRNHMLEDGGEMADGASVFEAIAEESRALANDLIAATEGEADGRLSTLAWRLDVLSQRVTKAMALLAHIDSRVSGTAPEDASESELAAKLVPENLKFFEEDEELFVPPPAEEPQAAPEPEPQLEAVKAEEPEKPIRDRVVIIRRTTVPPPMPAIVSDNVA
jgi:hypothetical protein